MKVSSSQLKSLQEGFSIMIARGHGLTVGQIKTFFHGRKKVQGVVSSVDDDGFAVIKKIEDIKAEKAA